MKCERLIVLAVAVRAGWVGYVLLIDGQPKCWRISGNATQSTRLAAKAMNEWIDKFDPSVIVLENHHNTKRKADKTQQIIKALYRAAAHAPAMISQVTRVQTFPNKFVEAKALAERYPELKPEVPDKHRLWEREPRNLVYFEAVALAKQSGFLPEAR